MRIAALLPLALTALTPAAAQTSQPHAPEPMRRVAAQFRDYLLQEAFAS